MAQQAIVSIKLEGGKSIKPFAQLVIVQRADWHHNFEVRLPLEVFEDKDGSLVENSLQYIGKTITIEIKSQFVGGTPNTFKGIVTEVSSSRHHGSDRELIFRGQSPTILLDDGPNNCSYTEKNLKQIADECTKPYPQNLISTSFNPKNNATIPYTVQYYESCYHFLSRLASLNGEWFYYDGTSIIFGEPTGPSIVLNFGKDLSHFSHSLKVGPSKYKLYSYDYLANQVHESPSSSASVPGLGNSSKLALGESESLFSNEPLHLTSRAIKEKSELDELNKNTKSKRASDLVVFSGISDNPGVTIGGKVKINRSKGSGENITVDDLGEYIVIGVSHSTDGRGNYQNQFEAIPATVASPPPNRNIANPVCEPQSAVVKQNVDPEGLGRVKVQFVWQQQPELSPWIRLMTTHSGEDRGFYFVPELEDEVWVGFEHNNPDKPYVLGSMYHGKAKPSGSWPNDNDDIKAIKTKSGNEIQINDEAGKEEIKIINKDGQNEFSMTLGGEGKIVIKTSGLLEISAKEITMTAEKTIDVKAGSDISVNADANANIVASKAALLKGSTTLDMEGGTAANVKAGVIKLN